MIYMLFGENDFLKRQRLAELLHHTEADQYDGQELDKGRLYDALLAKTLFGDERTIVVRDLSTNLEVWSALPVMTIPKDREVVLYEAKPDKRTKTYKWLQKNAKIEEFVSLSERDLTAAVKWCMERSNKVYGFELDRGVVKLLVERIGFDMGRLDMVLAQLAVSDDRSEQFVDEFLPLPKSENVFNLFEAAVTGQRDAIHRTIAYLEATSGDDGAYQTLGLLASQLFSLNALALSEGDIATVADELGVSSYGLRQLTPIVKHTSRARLYRMNHILSRADVQMKTTSVTPWLLVEAALLEIAE